MIRRAVPTDVFDLMEMGEAFFKEAGWDKHADFDGESFAMTCGGLIDGGILLVGENGVGKLVAMAGAALAPAYWNRKVLTSQELFWYCKPAHRKGLGRQLMAALEDAVQSCGVTLFSMSAEEGLRGHTLGQLYARRGYFPAEKLYWKRFEPVREVA